MPVIKIHYFSDDLPRLQKTAKGDWIDLYCAQTMQLHAGEFALIPLGGVDAAAGGIRGPHGPALVHVQALGHSAGQLRRRDRQQLLRHER